MMDSSRSSVKNTRTTHAESVNETREADEVSRGANVMKQPPLTTPTFARGGANELTATLMLPPPGLRASRKSAAPSFKKRAKPVISLGGQEQPNVYYVYGDRTVRSTLSTARP